MPEVQLEEIKEMIADHGKQVKDSVDEVKKQHGELDNVIKLIDEKIEKHGKALSDNKAEFLKQVERVEKAETALDSLIEKQAELFGGGGKVEKTLGQACAESDEAKNYKGGSAEILKWKGPLFSKAITDAAGSAEDAVVPLYRDGIVDDPAQVLTVRDLLTVIPTTEAVIKWVQENVFTNNAAAHGQNSAAGASNITFTKKTSNVTTLKHFIPASKEILSDVRGLQAFVDMKGRYGLKLEEESQLLFGDGTGDNLHGLYPQAVAYDTATYEDAADTNVDQMRKAILQVAVAKYPATGILMNPKDWADIELLKTDDNAYLFSNPTQGGNGRLWGKRVVESLSLIAGDGTTGGQFLAGAFGLAATLWDREEIMVRVAEQHADFFIEGMIAMLFEERVALSVERPAALVKGNFKVA